MNCGSEDPGTAKRVPVSNKGVAAARRRLEPGKCVLESVHLCRGLACKSVLHPLLTGGRGKTDHEGWRRAQIAPGGARFGTAEAGGGLGVLTVGESE